MSLTLPTTSKSSSTTQIQQTSSMASSKPSKSLTVSNIDLNTQALTIEPPELTPSQRAQAHREALRRSSQPCSTHSHPSSLLGFPLSSNSNTSTTKLPETFLVIDGEFAEPCTFSIEVLSNTIELLIPPENLVKYLKMDTDSWQRTQHHKLEILKREQQWWLPSNWMHHIETFAMLVGLGSVFNLMLGRKMPRTTIVGPGISTRVMSLDWTGLSYALLFAGVAMALVSSQFLMSRVGKEWVGGMVSYYLEPLVVGGGSLWKNGGVGRWPF
jgi:hypothetical protein